jgi:hypothetical protein
MGSQLDQDRARRRRGVTAAPGNEQQHEGSADSAPGAGRSTNGTNGAHDYVSFLRGYLAAMDHDAYSGSPGEGGADAETTRSVTGKLDGDLNAPGDGRHDGRSGEQTMVISAREIQAIANGTKQASPEQTTVLKPVKPDDPPPEATAKEATATVATAKTDHDGLVRTTDDFFGVGPESDPEANGFWFSPEPGEDDEAEQPAKPEKPVAPEKPAEPKATAPEKTTGPEKTTAPRKATEPTKTIEPPKPAESQKPAESATPEEPKRPEESKKTEEPEKSEKSAPAGESGRGSFSGTLLAEPEDTGESAEEPAQDKPEKRPELDPPTKLQLGPVPAPDTSDRPDTSGSSGRPGPPDKSSSSGPSDSPKTPSPPEKPGPPEKPDSAATSELSVQPGMVDATTKRASTFAGGRRSGNSGLSGSALFSDYARAGAGAEHHLALRGRLEPGPPPPESTKDNPIKDSPVKDSDGPGTAPLPTVRNEDGQTRG